MFLLHNKYIIRFLCVLLVASLSSGCIRFVTKRSSSDVKEAVKAKETEKVTHHRVEKGETLYSIAFQYGYDYRDVAAWNNIDKTFTIYPQQRLRVVPIAADETIKKQVQRSNKTKTYKTIKKIPVKPAETKPVKRFQNARPVWRWPTEGKVISSFSYRDPGRRGIDISGHNGQAILAAAAGTVVYKGNGLRGYGNLIILKHNDTYFSAYAHNSNVRVKENEKVKSGQRIADMGSTGTDKNKLHFEIRRDGKPVNPLKYLPRKR